MRAIAALLLLFASLAAGQYQLPPPVYPYKEACKEAACCKKVLVVFVGHRPTFDLTNCVTSQTDFLPGYPAQCVVVAYPKGDWVQWQATLPMGASKQLIADASTEAMVSMLRKEVTAPAVDPFRFVQQPRSSTYCPT